MEVSASVNPFDHSLYLITSTDITTRTAAQAFDEIDDGTLLINYTARTDPGSQTIEINSARMPDLVAEHIANDYLSFGFRMEDETLIVGNRGLTFDSDSGGTPLVLTIVYAKNVDAVLDTKSM